MVSDGTALRRYTNLAGLIHVLHTRRITLLSPDKWDDGNDRHFMSVYKERKKLKTLVAICFAKDADTYHHWRVFSPNSDGVCIVFHKRPLIAMFEGHPGVRHREVHYEEIKRLPDLSPMVADLPFMKRYPYKPEGEYRVIYEDFEQEVAFKDFECGSELIKEIVLSPWMPTPLVESVRITLKSMKGCQDIPIYQSTLVSNSSWMAVTDQISD